MFGGLRGFCVARCTYSPVKAPLSGSGLARSRAPSALGSDQTPCLGVTARLRIGKIRVGGCVRKERHDLGFASVAS